MTTKLFSSKFSNPKLNKNNPRHWYIFYSFRVPEELLKPESRTTKRFKVYAGINRVADAERMPEAMLIMKALLRALKNGSYNPFQNELNEYYKLKEPDRKTIICSDVLREFITSRVNRKLDRASIVAYQGTVDWLKSGINTISAGQLRHIDLSRTLDKISVERSWSATTINKEWGYVFTILNWMETEDYIVKNPCRGKVTKLRTHKTHHRWYDKATAVRVKSEIRESKTPWMINVCQFVYEILIRSKEELRSIKVGDIDFELRRVNFRKEWTKNSSDQSRDYSEAFHALVLKMGLDKLDKNLYVFSTGGKPGHKMCGHNTFSRAWAAIRTDLKISEDYTVYGWKHTRVVHEMMKGTNGYDISHLARHSSVQTTDDYKRDYDITLNRVYGPEDLRF
jgi:integrase